MKNKEKTKSTGIKAFNTMFIIGIVFAGTKMIDYLQWTFQLIKKWSLPDDPFFSNVYIVASDVEMSVTAYLVFAIAYMSVFGFIFLGLYQLNSTSKLFEEQKIFQNENSVAFKKAGKSFLYFAYGTLIIDVAFLAWAKASSKLFDLLSTELLVFLILGYWMFFLADVFKAGIHLRQENELTS